MAKSNQSSLQVLSSQNIYIPTGGFFSDKMKCRHYSSFFLVNIFYRW